MTTPTRKVLSYGGGLDSFAMLLDALTRGEKPDAVVFCDVADGTAEREGVDPGEWPSTYRHMREVVMPICAREGVEFVWLSSDMVPMRDGHRSLFAWMKSRNNIPVAGPSRVCTPIAKTERFEAWCNTRFPGETVEVWIGFEAGEEDRADKDPNAGKTRRPRKLKPGQLAPSVRVNRFPLIERGLCRCRCVELVRAAGLPVPRKSACTFCPYASKRDWQTLARELPETFATIVQLEADKPPTAKNGLKLSIMGYRTQKNADGTKTAKPKALPVFIQGTYRAKVTPCTVCGAADRATKATGCDYLPDEKAA
jgi:hypothetical protein